MMLVSVMKFTYQVDIVSIMLNWGCEPGCEQSGVFGVNLFPIVSSAEYVKSVGNIMLQSVDW